MLDFHRIRRFLRECEDIVHEVVILVLAVDGLLHVLRLLN